MRFITLSLFATLLSAPAFAADLGTYRPGTPYSSTVAGGADVCDSHCAGDAQCRGWNYVKPNPRAAGVCEFLSSVSSPISSPISISGESQSANSFSSLVTSVGTNTIRVGTQTAPRPNTVRVGQSASGRKVIRQAPTQRITPQQASTRPIENLSLTEQQNRYRNTQPGLRPSPVRPQAPRAVAPQSQTYSPQQQAYIAAQRRLFRPILDGSTPQAAGQQFRQPRPQPQPQNVSGQSTRRPTGPRSNSGQNQAFGQGHPVPQFNDPRAQTARSPGQNFQQPFQASQQVAQRGQARPPVGQPIQAPQRPTRPQASTPSQRLAQLTAKTRAEASTATSSGTVALNPDQAKKSLFGRLNDDLPKASAVPTRPVTEEPLADVLAGGI